MALSRKQLAALGIEADKIDQIIEAHTETVSGLKDTISQLRDDLKTAQADQATLKDVQQKYDNLMAQVDADKKANEGKDYDALKKEYDDYKADVTAKAEKAAKEKALRDLLKDMNVSEKGTGMIIKWQGVNGVQLDESGKLTNGAELRKSIKEDWADFIPAVEKKGADTKTPPGSDQGGNGGKTKDEIMAIKDAGERQKAIAENPGLFGIE